MNWKDKLNQRYLQISLYVIFTAVVIYSLSLVARNAPIILGQLMDKLQWLLGVIKPVIIAFAIAYLMDPIIWFFQKKYLKLKWIRKTRTSRVLAVVTAVFLFVILFAGLISLLVFSVTDQLRLADFDDIINLGEEYMKSLEAFYKSILVKLKDMDIQSNELEQYVNDATTYLIGGLMSFADSTVSALANISDYLTTIIFSIIIGFYFMIDGRVFTKYLKKVFFALFSLKTNERLRKVMADLDVVFSGYIRGQLTDAIIMMLLISITLSIIGVKFAIVIGVAAGLGNLVPYFGPVIAYISTTFVCLINGDIRRLVIALIALVIIQTIDGNFIGPKLLSHSIQIHPLIVIVSLIFGSALGGLTGMLLAVPVGAFIKLVFVQYIDQRVEKKKKLLEGSATLEKIEEKQGKKIKLEK